MYSAPVMVMSGIPVRSDVVRMEGMPVIPSALMTSLVFCPLYCTLFTREAPTRNSLSRFGRNTCESVTTNESMVN